MCNVNEMEDGKTLRRANLIGNNTDVDICGESLRTNFSAHFPWSLNEFQRYLWLSRLLTALVTSVVHRRGAHHGPFGA
jgi:hypothetical protein